MKGSILTIGLLSLSAASIAQLSGPSVEGVYLPIRGTIVEQVWADGQEVAMDMPEMGENVTWDYVSWFVDSGFTLDTNRFETLLPENSPIGAGAFPTASHSAVYFSNDDVLDSVYSFFEVGEDGLNQVGAYDGKLEKTFDLPIPELIAPKVLQYGMDPIMDTSMYASAPEEIGDTTYQGQDIEDATLTLYIDRYRVISVEGHGSLVTAAVLPNITFNDVVMMKEKVIEKQRFVMSGVVDFGGFSSTVTHTIEGESYYYSNFNFIRQIGAGSDMQMSLQTDSAETEVIMGWYALPLRTGKICGTVTDTDGSPITAGEVFFYEENELYPKNDLSAVVTIDNGNYCLDSAQYGLFRVAAKADASTYPNSLTTYLGDVTKWSDNEQVRLLSDSMGGNDIQIQYGAENTGLATFSGQISTDFTPYLPETFKTNGEPIPGIDVSLEQVPGGIVAQTTTDEEVGFFFDNINVMPGEVYEIHVDIPGLPVSSTHELTMTSDQDSLDQLNFDVLKTEIVKIDIPVDTTSNVVDSNTAVVEIDKVLDGLTVYPNPFANQVTFDLNQAADNGQLAQLRITNTIGKVVDIISVPQQVIRYDASGLKPGVYFFEAVATGGNSGTGRLVKLK